MLVFNWKFTWEKAADPPEIVYFYNSLWRHCSIRCLIMKEMK